MSTLTSRSLSILVVAIVFACMGTASAQDSQQKLLRWFDVQAKQSVRAFFEEVDNGIVKLKTKNGESYSIAVDRLSSANQRYIKNLQAKSNDPAAAAKNDAQPQAVPENNDAQPVAKPIAGSLAKPKTMYGVRWEPMDNLVTDQKIPDAENKPVFWFRVLGDLEGFM